MLDKLIAAIREVADDSKESWLTFQEELAKVSVEDLEKCHGLDNKSLPLFVAIKFEKPKIVEALIKKCPAITHVLNDKGQHALFWVDDYGGIADILLSNMSTSLITCRDNEKNNILHIQAGLIGNAKIFAKLCEAFPWLVNQLNLNKETPLHFTHDTEKAKILTEKMSIETICQISSSKNEDFIEYKQYKGSTALHYAVLSENKEMIELLITRCPDLLYIPNAADKTPYEIAGNNIKNLIGQLISNYHKIEEASSDCKVESLVTSDENNLQELSYNGQTKDIDIDPEQINS